MHQQHAKLPVGEHVTERGDDRRVDRQCSGDRAAPACRQPCAEQRGGQRQQRRQSTSASGAAPSAPSPTPSITSVPTTTTGCGAFATSHTRRCRHRARRPPAGEHQHQGHGRYSRDQRRELRFADRPMFTRAAAGRRACWRIQQPDGDDRGGEAGGDGQDPNATWHSPSWRCRSLACCACRKPQRILTGPTSERTS